MKYLPTSYKLQATSCSGFTLIELLISISLLGLVFLISVQGFRSFDQTNVVRISENRLADALRTAQSLALSGRSIENNALTPLAFGVHIDTTTATAFVFADTCHATPQTAGFGTWDSSLSCKKIGNDISLAQNGLWPITLTVVPNSPVDIAFKRTTATGLINGGATGDPKMVTVAFKNTKNNVTKNLVFDRISGRVDTEY